MQATVLQNAQFRANPEHSRAKASETYSGKDFGQVQTDDRGQRYMPKRKGMGGRDLRPTHANSEKLRMLFWTNISLRDTREEVNPMWHNFDSGEKCVRPVESVDEMKALLKHHGQTDDVLVVRYWQDGCTACNALAKIYEWACRDSSKRFTKLKFVDVKREDLPKLCEGMVRYPQLKAFSGGMWGDIDFKPPQDFREMIYSRVEKEVHRAAKRGQPVSALQAEEMYYSVAGPAVATVVEESLFTFYNRSQVRLHNYWKQVSERRSWYFKEYVEPVGQTDEQMAEMLGKDKHDFSIFGETTTPGVTAPSAAPHNIANAAPSNIGSGPMRDIN